MAAEIPVKISLVGKEEVESGIKSVKDAFVSAGKAATEAFVVLEIFQKVKEYTIGASEKAKELTQANLQLKAALGYTSEALDSQAEAISKKYMIEEKDIKQMQTHLAMNHLTEEQIKKLTPAILNYAAAQGIDLVSATNNVTKAIEGQGHSMRGVPGIIAGASGSMEKIDSVITLLNGKFHDQADAILESKDGWDRFGFTLKEWNKEFGIVLFGLGKDAKAIQDNKNATDDLSRSKAELLKVEAIQAGMSDKNKTGFQKYLDSLIHNKEGLADERKELEANIAKREKEIKSYEDSQKAIKDRAIAENKAAKQQEENEAKAEAARKKAIVDAKKKVEEEKKAQEEVEKMRRDGIKKAGEAKEKEREEIEKQNEEAKESQRKADEVILKMQEEDRMAGWEIIRKAQTKEDQKTFKGRLKLLKDEHKQEIDLAKKTGASTILLEKQHAEEIKAITVNELQMKTEMYGGVAESALGNLQIIAEASHANAGVMKAIAMSEAAINTAVGATKALTATPYPPVNIALMALTIAAGIAQEAIIASKPMAYGGVVTGGIPGVDSVPATLMPGEIVYNPAHPNPALASMISNSSTTNDNSNTLHVYGPTINVSGDVSQKTISKISQATHEQTVKSVHSAIRTLQARGKMAGVTLYN
jgi:hypothetical protein